MKHIRKLLLAFVALWIILSCARIPQYQVGEKILSNTLDFDEKKIELHPVYVMPRGTPMGPGIPFGVAEGLDVKKVEASTVRVVYGEGDSTMISSGFFVANDKIATNIHVVAAADLASLHVRTDNTDWTIRGVTAFDTQNDLVILQISGEGAPFALGNSDTVSSGETVFCVGYIGYPVGKFNVMENTVLPGRLNGAWLRVTPTILPGNSGGPVLNTEGEVIGINVAGSGPIGYAIESNVLKALLKQSVPIESLAQWQKRDLVHAYAYRVQALEKFHAADYAGAIDVLDKAIALNPTCTGIGLVYNNRGYAKTHFAYFAPNMGHVEGGQQYYHAAIQDFDKAISINPENISVYANRGYAKSLLGHSDLNRGRAQEALRHYHAAIEDFDKAISVNPEFPAYAERGTVKISLGKVEINRGYAEVAQQYYRAAIKDFDKAISLDREDTYAYVILGYTRICLADFESDKGDLEAARSLYEAAITDCDSAIQLDAENPYCYHTRGVVKAKLNDYNGAIDDFDKTVSLKPDFARAYYNRAIAKGILGQKGAAKVDFERARELDPDVEK